MLRRVKIFSIKKAQRPWRYSGFKLIKRNQGLHTENFYFKCRAYYTPSLFPVNFFCVNIH
nr:MAG TPA: hypothetical protein [Caudoviricetes sp.]